MTAPPPTDPIVDVAGLTKRYGDVTVLRGLDLRVERGTIFALLGPNGAGKTTAVGILTTLVRPDGGHATIDGHDLVADPAGVRASISLTGQHVAVDDFLTGAENLRMMARLAHLGAAEARTRAAHLLAQFDLADAGDRRVATYSGGMRRRLDLAASLVTRPPLLFLDEPTTGLDPRSRLALWDAVRSLAAEGTTVFLTTQYLEEADQLADRLALLDDGRIVAEGTAAELKARLSGEHVVVSFATDDALRAAEAAAGAVGPTELDAGARALRVAAPSGRTADTARALLDGLDRAGVAVASIAIEQPTLDDVFLALTDRTPVDVPDHPLAEALA